MGLVMCVCGGGGGRGHLNKAHEGASHEQTVTAHSNKASCVASR